MSNPSAKCAGAVILLGILSIIVFIVLVTVCGSFGDNNAPTAPQISILGENYEAGKFEAKFLYKINGKDTQDQTFVIYSHPITTDPLFAVTEDQPPPPSLNFYQRILLQCTSKHPLQWTYEGNGYSNGQVYNQRKLSDFEDPGTYYYVSTLVFSGIQNGFQKTCSGRYICKIKDSVGLEHLLEPFVWINVRNETNSTQQWNPEKNPPESCHKWEYNLYESQDLGNAKVLMNTTENKFMCCGARNKSVSATFKMCGTTDECNLRRFCDGGACVTAHKFSNSFFSRQYGRCVQIEGTCPGKMTGEIVCSVGMESTKFMTYSKLPTVQPIVGVAVEYPSDISDVSIDPELILELRKQNGSIINTTSEKETFYCSGPTFYVAYGFIWGLEKEDGSISYVPGDDGPFVAPLDVFAELDYTVVEKAQAVKVYCITPLVNSLHTWINVSMSLTP